MMYRALVLLLLVLIVINQGYASDRNQNARAGQNNLSTSTWVQAVGGTEHSTRIAEAWSRAEGADPNCFNPFNTSMVMGQGESTVNSHGVKCYPSADVGYAATRATLALEPYKLLLQYFRSGDELSFLSELPRTPWGTDASLVQEILLEQTVYRSNVLDATGGDDCTWNAQVAIQYGNLSDIRIAPGDSWSYNKSVGVPRTTPYRYCAGYVAGYLCNLASRYAQTARLMGLTVQLYDHGIDLGAGRENSTAILMDDDGNTIDNQDLIIYNGNSRTVRLYIVGEGHIQIVGEFL